MMASRVGSDVTKTTILGCAVRSGAAVFRPYYLRIIGMVGLVLGWIWREMNACRT